MSVSSVGAGALSRVGVPIWYIEHICDICRLELVEYHLPKSDKDVPRPRVHRTTRLTSRRTSMQCRHSPCGPYKQYIHTHVRIDQDMS